MGGVSVGLADEAPNVLANPANLATLERARIFLSVNNSWTGSQDSRVPGLIEGRCWSRTQILFCKGSITDIRSIPGLLAA